MKDKLGRKQLIEILKILGVADPCWYTHLKEWDYTTAAQLCRLKDSNIIKYANDYEFLELKQKFEALLKHLQLEQVSCNEIKFRKITKRNN